MSFLSPARAEALFWLSVFGGLTVSIGLETDWGKRLQSSIPVHQREPSPFPRPELTEPFKLPSPDEYLDTSMRPLFVATRRPAPSSPALEAPKPAMKHDQFSLTGITILPEGKFAFLTEKAGNKSRIVQEGKDINGILVKEITNDRVVLSQYEETEVLLLKTAKGPAATINPAGGKEKDAAAAGGVAGDAAEKSQAGAPPSAASAAEATRSAARAARQAGRAAAQHPAPNPPAQQGAAPQ